MSWKGKRAWRLLRAVLPAMVKVGGRRLKGQGRQPPCPWRAEVLIEVLKARTTVGERLPAAEIRRRERATPVPRRLRERLRFETAELGGVPCEVIVAGDRGSDGGEPGALVYFHGGGYNVCSPATHRNLTARLALATGLRTVVPDYRLAPEHPHPAAVEDALAVWRALRSQGQLPERMVVAGDSAGGGLSLAALVASRDQGEPLPAAAVLISPWVDLTCRQPTIDRHEASDYVSRVVLEKYARAYAGGAELDHPGISPLHAELSGLVPMLIHAGGAETLVGESRELAEKARAAGNEVELRIWDGGIHVFHAFAPVTPGSPAAIAEIGAFARRWVKARL